jgi:hypothetical protein
MLQDDVALRRFVRTLSLVPDTIRLGHGSAYLSYHSRLAAQTTDFQTCTVCEHKDFITLLTAYKASLKAAPQVSTLYVSEYHTR